MPERYARCFSPGVNYRSQDYVLIRVEDAREMVNDGLAELVNRGKDIRMFSRAIIKLRDRSCSWSHRLVDLIADGNVAAKNLLEAWDTEMLDSRSPLGRTMCPLEVKAA